MPKMPKGKTKPRKVLQAAAYKFRAECFNDIVAFLAELKIDRCLRIEITPLQGMQHLPDRECTLLVENMTQKQILDAMRKVVDGHVMVQTLMPLGSYDGERK